MLCLRKSLHACMDMQPLPIFIVTLSAQAVNMWYLASNKFTASLNVYCARVLCVMNFQNDRSAHA